MLSGCELIDTENISLSRQNMKWHWETKPLMKMGDFDVCNKKIQ
jgi:hypothetical protein